MCVVGTILSVKLYIEKTSDEGKDVSQEWPRGQDPD